METISQSPIRSVRVCEEDFDLSTELARLRACSADIGAVASFVGLVRDVAEGLVSLELEHYPGMTEKMLERIIDQACERWPLQAVTVIHRVGRLSLQDQIVLVAVASAHRREAFRACEFIIDYLKNQAPLWKKEFDARGERWLEAKQSDIEAQQDWDDNRR